MVHFSLGQQCVKLLPDGLLLMYGWMAGMGIVSLVKKPNLSRDNRASTSVLRVDVPLTSNPLTTPQGRHMVYGYGRLRTIAADAGATLVASTQYYPSNSG
jgi:hypothetical protein